MSHINIAMEKLPLQHRRWSAARVPALSTSFLAYNGSPR